MDLQSPSKDLQQQLPSNNFWSFMPFDSIFNLNSTHVHACSHQTLINPMMNNMTTEHNNHYCHGGMANGSASALMAVCKDNRVVVTKSVEQQQHNDLATLKLNGRRSVNIHENPFDQDLVEKGLTVKILEPSMFSRMTLLERYLSTAVCLLTVICLFFIVLTTVRPYEPPIQVCLTEECVKTASSLMAAMDMTANPCEDFFQFACGSWNKRHVIPEDRSRISTFEVLADELQIILKGVLDEPWKDTNDATAKAKIFYKSCMNLSQIQTIGDAPIKEILTMLGGWPVVHRYWNLPNTSTEKLLGLLRGKFNQGIIVEQWVGPDDKNSSVNIIQLDQMNLGLPGRDYYIKDSSYRELEAYHKLMSDVAVLLGAERKQAHVQMKDVLDFEIKLANVSLPEAERHDTGAIYKKLVIEDLSKIVPHINWLEYLNAFLPTKVGKDEPIVVYALPYLKQMGKIVATTDKRVITNYVLWRLILEFLPYMGEEYQTIRAEFRKVIWGISADRLRWNQCVDLVNSKMGMAVGALFVRDNFNQESKETALEMIHNIREAFNELLAENDWMDEETRQVAREKANAMNERIGYPELLTNPWELNKDYETLKIDENNFFQNVFNALHFEATKNLMKLRQPVNKDRWTTEPAVVNAFYNPNKNDIVFPAGILQPLFYSQHFPKSLNYGGIGVVIGHEITHGFDDKGRQFDKNGNLKQWWNNKTIKTFRERAQCIIDQYSNYILDEVGLPINGKMTQGENIADNGGLKQAFRAYKKFTSKHGQEMALPGINLTHDQLFFLNYAQIWCGSMRPEDALNKIRSSVHSPGPIRVLGPLSNSYDFAKAYKCTVGSRMNPEKKCAVW